MRDANAEELISRNKKDREGRDIISSQLIRFLFHFLRFRSVVKKRLFKERMFLKPSSERISFGFMIGVDTVDKGWSLTLDRTRPATTASS